MAVGATNTISGAIKWTGIASETDFGAVVEAMIGTERRVVTKQETWKSQWQEKLTAINKLDTQLSAVKMAAQDYGTRDKLLSRKGTSSDEKVVTISNTSTAATGSYSVEVAEKTNAIHTSRSYKEGEDIGMNFKTNAKGQPVDRNGDVLAVTRWNVDSALAILGSKLSGGTTNFPIKFNSAYNTFVDANDQVVAKYDINTNSVLDENDVTLFGLDRDAWLMETTLANVAAKLGDPSMSLRFAGASTDILDSTNTVVATLDSATSTYYDTAVPPNALFTLGSDGISTTWETDNALAMLSQRFSTNLPLSFDTDTNKFTDSAGTVVAKRDPSTNEIYDPNDRDAVFFTMSRHSMTNWDDPAIIKFLEEHKGVSETATKPFYFDPRYNEYYSTNGQVVAELDPATGNITMPGSTQILLQSDAAGRLIDPATKEPIINSDADRRYYAPMTFTMNGKTLELEYDPEYDPATNGIQPFKFSENCSMEELRDIINASIADPSYDGPNIKAEILFDKNRTEGDDTVAYNRLRIIGLDSGSENSIEIYDPTDLCLDETAIDEPLRTQWIGSTAQPQLAADSKYTGHVNKTITFVVAEGGTLGSDEVILSWADTENKAGRITIAPEDWDSAKGCLKKDLEIEQGVKINFNRGTNGNDLMKNNAFTIDCQAPVVQQAADSGLAQSDKWVHRGFPSSTSPVTLGSGNFDFSYAGVNYSVPIRSDSTLSAMAEAINTHSKNPGVIASVLNDGMGTATSYKLVLTGAQSGAEHQIRVLDTTKLTQVDMSPENFEHARVATNSMCRIDGYPSDGLTWIQRPTNEVGDVLDGTVLQLQSTGKATVNIVNDLTAMTDKIKSIIESVNITLSYISEQTRYAGGKFTINVLKDGTIQRTTEGGEASGVMIGNYGFQISNSELKKIMSSQIFTQDEFIKAVDPDGEKQALLPREEQKKLYETYLEENGLVYTRLSDIGIAFDAKASTDYAKDTGTGAYVIEQSKLNEALRKNPEAVLKLFTFKPTDDPLIKEYTHYEDEADRPLLYGGVLTKMFYSMSDLTRSSDVYDKDTGDLVQPAKGIMRVLSENYSNIISGIDDKIAREEKRIGLKQQRLEEKFSRLEVMIAQLNQQSSKIEAELKKLNGS